MSSLVNRHNANLASGTVVLSCCYAATIDINATSPYLCPRFPAMTASTPTTNNTNGIHIFDSLSAEYDDAFAVFLKHTTQKLKAREWLTATVDALGERDVLVDVGAGNGIITLSPDFKRTICIEPNPTLASQLQAKYPEVQVLIKLIADVQLTPVASFILCSHVLYYIDVAEWIETVQQMASWLTPNGKLIIIIQNPQTDCMKLLRHFTGKTFDLSSMIQAQSLTADYDMTLETVDSYINTESDFNAAYRISEFVMNLLPQNKPLSQAELSEYVQTNWKDKTNNKYYFSCHQDFLTITRRKK